MRWEATGRRSRVLSAGRARLSACQQPKVRTRQVGGQRIARLVEALSLLAGDSLPPYTSEAACSLSARSLEIAEERLRLAARALLSEKGGLLQAAWEIAAERGGCDGDAIEPSDLLAAGAKVRMLDEPTLAEAVAPEGVAAAAEMLAGWLRDARAETGGAYRTLVFCTVCSFTLPCPWGC